MRILLLDRGLPFDGATLREQPLGGAESAFVHLAEAFAVLGHEVEARTAAARPMRLNGVIWDKVDDAAPNADLLIANRVPALLGSANAHTKLMWLHNPAGYLRKPRHLWPMLRYRPRLVVLGRYHASTVPRFLPRRALHEIPLGLDPQFVAEAVREPLSPIAIFTSNPERGLDRLVDVWARAVHPLVPHAELHIYAGAETYGGKNGERIAASLAAAREARTRGVHVFPPLPKTELVAKLRAARVMAYRGDAGETFCLAAAEARACGVPLVTQGYGALTERVVDGETGFLAPEDSAFAARLVQVLQDDGLWRRLHRGCIAHPAAPPWEQIAKQFLAACAFR